MINVSDPLALLAIATTPTSPVIEDAARGSSQLDSKQRAAKIGEPIPLVFCRRRNDQGGVLISPACSHARFENSATNEVTAYYHLILSDGLIGKIQVRDIFQRNCRRGSFTQTFDRCAGTWDPGNYVVSRIGYDTPQCPQYCGTIGSFEGVSTLSFQVTAPDGSDEWNRQVHAFIRDGNEVTRLYDNATGSSDNYCDFWRYALLATKKVPAELIDTATLATTAAFLEKQGFTCNVWLQQSENLAGLSAAWSKWFLLRESVINGKRGLKPLLPVTAGGDFVTDPILPVYTFDEDLIVPGSLTVDYTSYGDRQFFCAQINWRQQPENDMGIVRTAEVRYAGTALTGPYESHDLSEFMTNELHAVRSGAYAISKRCRTDHKVRFNAKPEAHTKFLKTGDIIRVKVKREVAAGSLSYFDWLEQVDRITKTGDGGTLYECSHFPVDASGRSLIILDILAAQATGIIVPNPRTGPSCDTNSANDTSVPAESGRSGVGGGGSTIPFDGGSPGSPAGEPPNAEDGLDEPSTTDPPGVWPAEPDEPDEPDEPGSALYMPSNPCGPGVTPFFRWLKNGEPVQGNNSRYYVIGTAEIMTPGMRVPLKGQYRCPTDKKWQETSNVYLPDDVVFTGQIEYYVDIRPNDPWSGMRPGIFGSNWFSDIPVMQTATEAGGIKVAYFYLNNALFAQAFYNENPPTVEVIKSRYRPNQSAPWQEREYTGSFADPGQPWIE